MLREMQREFSYAYRSMYDLLEGIEDINSPRIDFHYKARLARVSALEESSTLMEGLGLSGAWIFHRLKHPIKMHRWIKELNKKYD